MSETHGGERPLGTAGEPPQRRVTWPLIPREWRSWWHAANALALLVSAAAYLVALPGEFVWDDHYLVGGQAIGGGNSLVKCFTEPFLGHYFRPLVSVSFFVERKLFGFSAGAYHLTNLLLHVLGALGVMGMLREAWGRRWVVPLATLVFAVHPVHVGAVAWIGGRTDAAACAFLAASGYGLLRAARAGSRGAAPWLALSVAAYACAVFTKEQCIAALPLVPLAYACFPAARSARLPGAGWVAALPFVLVCALYLALGYHLGFPSQRGAVSGARDVVTLTGQTLTHYVLLLFAPSPRWMHTTSLGPMVRAGWPAVAGGYLAALLALMLFVHWWRTDRAAAWFLAHGALLLGPVSNIVPLPYIQAVPYRAALSGIGAAALIGLHLEWVIRPRRASTGGVSPARAAGLVAASAALAWMGGLTVAGARAWTTEQGIFRQFLRADPDSIAVTYTYAAIELASGRDASAAAYLSRTLDLLFAPGGWRTPGAVRRGLTPVLWRKARQNQGSPDPPHLWVGSLFTQLGFAHIRLEQPEQAAPVFLAGLVADPSNADLYAGVGAVAMTLGRHGQAVSWYERAVGHATGGQHAYIYGDAGRSHAAVGNWPRAIERYRQWVKALPGRPEPYLHLADALARSRRLDEAIATVQEALRISPGHETAQQMLSWMEEARAASAGAR